MFRPVDVAESYARASGRSPGDLTWHIAYAAIRHGAIMRRVTERSIFFGEAEAPDDIDELIIHRATLRGHPRRLLLGRAWPSDTRPPRAARRRRPLLTRTRMSPSRPRWGWEPVIIG